MGIEYAFVGFADFLNWQLPLAAGLIVKNGVIYTSDDSLPFIESMAVYKGRIVRVGNYSFVKVFSVSIRYLYAKLVT